MSKIALTPNASGSGTFTIASPNSDTDRTLTLPDEAGTVLTSASSIPSSQITGSLGITMADQWRLTTNITSNGILTALEQVDESSFGNLGTPMSESSGVFTFPVTGIYLVTLNSFIETNGLDNVSIVIDVTINNSSYDNYALASTGNDASVVDTNTSASAIIDVTDTTQVKVRFNVSSLNGSSQVRGNTGRNDTYFTFIRLGDT